MNETRGVASATADNSLYPSAQAEPELGGANFGLSSDDDVVATLEMTDITPIHELKLQSMEDASAKQQQYKIGPTVVAVPPTSSAYNFNNQPLAPAIAMHLQEKQGSKCCGCCCDYKRAVIITNSFFIGFALVTILFLQASPTVVEETFTDDEFVNDVTDILYENYVKRSIGLGVAILTSIIAIGGAVHFKIPLLAIHVVMLVADFISYVILLLQLVKDLDPLYAEQGIATTSPMTNIIFIGTLTALFMYPHLGLIIEIRDGIMSHETYPREEYSCCCVSNRPRLP